MPAVTLPTPRAGQAAHVLSVKERLARIRAVAATRQVAGYDPHSNPLQQFRKHHTDWGGFANGGELLR